jgi:hypothetical protein
VTGTSKTIEWNLGFSTEEVTEGLEKSFNRAGYTYSRIEADAETQFQIALSSGSLRVLVQPLPPHHSPFNPYSPSRRTRLVMMFAGVSSQEEADSLRRLTLTFLRAGG